MDHKYQPDKEKSGRNGLRGAWKIENEGLITRKMEFMI